jgi:glycosyltransferase involved in cell wall biosynthesis
MNSSPLVSIIIPCYNQAQFLTETLESVYHQTHTNWECLIINDGSPDNTEEIALEWCVRDKRFKYFKKENGGLSSARNFGIHKSNGQWIQFLDSDDLIEKDKISHQVRLIEKFSAGILISGYRYFYHSEGKNNLRILGRNKIIPEVFIQETDTVDLIDLFKLRNPFVISAPLYNILIFNLVGMFDENLDALEDWDFHLRCVKKGIKFQHLGYGQLSKTLIRIHGQSIMSSDKRIESAYLLLANKHGFDAISSVQKKHKIRRIYSLLMPTFLAKMVNYFRNNGN